jgi:hypothetical protein
LLIRSSFLSRRQIEDHGGPQEIRRWLAPSGTVEADHWVDDRGASASRSRLRCRSVPPLGTRRYSGRRDVGISVLYVRRVTAVRPSRLIIILAIKSIPAPLLVRDTELRSYPRMCGCAVADCPLVPASQWPAALRRVAAILSPWPTVALVLLRVKNPRPDIHSTVEWRDAGQRYNEHVEHPESFTITPYRGGMYPRIALNSGRCLGPGNSIAPVADNRRERGGWRSLGASAPWR